MWPRQFLSKGRSSCPFCVAASRLSIRRVTRSRARSAAPAATSTPLSTGLIGIWSRTASVATSSTTVLEDVKDTEPYKWNGGNPNLPTECGPRTEKYFWRSENYDDLTLTDLVVYIRSLPPRPNRWRLPGNELTQAQERGKAIFERAVDKFGKPIRRKRIAAPIATAAPKAPIRNPLKWGRRKPTDNPGLLDTPQLTNIAMTGPYLHDGSARTLEEIWTILIRKTSTAGPTT